MENILYKRMADLTIIEMLDFAELYNIVKFPTINLDDFCRITQKNKRQIYTMINDKEIPENLIVDGFGFRSQRKSPIFHSKAVIEWIGAKRESSDKKMYKSSSEISREITKYLTGK